VTKHPEKKDASDARLQEYQKSANEMIEFLSRSSLRPAHLDRATPEATGWVFFDTKSKWLGGWKAQEEFVLRLPLDGKRCSSFLSSCRRNGRVVAAETAVRAASGVRCRVSAITSALANCVCSDYFLSSPALKKSEIDTESRAADRKRDSESRL